MESTRKIIIDPVTRIEGHLKIELEVEEGKVTRAKSSGTMFRGIEHMLAGRDPRDAIVITQRMCGVCPIIHGLTAVRLLENTVQETVPSNARLIRNIVAGANLLQSHILHFYLLTLFDYVHAPQISPLSVEQEDVNRFSQSDTELFVEHYKQALTIRQKAHEIIAIWGGRMPVPSGLVFGGVTEKITSEKIASSLSLLGEIADFITTIYYPDVIKILQTYPDYSGIGTGYANYLAFGGYNLDDAGSSQLLPRGAFIQGTVEDFKPEDITEHIKHSYYKHDAAYYSPSKGSTIPEHDKQDAYSWGKSPRYKNLAVEVGPLARIMIAYHKGTKEIVQSVNESLSMANMEVSSLSSVSGRHLSRAVESKLFVGLIPNWLNELEPEKPVYTLMKVPDEGESESFAEAPRGAIGHWAHFKEGKIINYQIMSPTTWNASPADSNNIPGPLEKALQGTPVKNESNPIEALRIVRSFDPCLACAVHALKTRKKYVPVV